MLKPLEMKDLRIEVYRIKDEDLELRQKEILKELNQEKLIDPSSKQVEALAEILTWIDQKIEGLPQESFRSWWFRAKRRAKYLKPI